MRIACVQSFPIDYCIDFVNAVAGIGEVDFLVSKRNLGDRGPYIDSRIRTTCLDWPRHRSLANVNLLRQMSNVIRSRDYDVVHFLGDNVTWLNFLPYIIGRRPTVTTVHDAMVHPGDTESGIMPNFVVDRFNRSATRLIVHGERIRQALSQRLSRSPEVIDIIPHIGLLRYAELAKREALKPTSREGRRNVLFFGRIMAYKGLPVLLDAVPTVKEAIPELKLVIAGRGPALNDLRPRLQAEHIEVHDAYIPDQDVAQLFLNTDVVALPYIEASQSGILALAAAFGKPAVVSDVGEIGELVRSTGMGLVVPPHDPKALSDAIQRILSNPDLARELSEASANAVQGNGFMSRNSVADLAHACYERAINAEASVSRRAG
jgi:glycosyltransferase involved in cell wall biosynthesis